MKIALPLIADEAVAQRARHELAITALAADERGAKMADVAVAAFSASTHLFRLAQRRPETLAAIIQQGPEPCLERALADARDAANAPDVEALHRDLRLAKADVHLCLGLGDLAGIFDLNATTAGLSDFADVAVQSALAAVARFEGVAPGEGGAGPVPGYFVLAMGKLGAGELNYSSDIDLVVFYDPAVFALGLDEQQKLATKLTQELVKAIETRTEHDYVFRTDLRLRPDPGATPPAVSVDAAESYYESFGQNWERAAFIKARYMAGDAQAAETFRAVLDAFVWRKNLDFAAIADIHSIKRQINAHRKLGGLNEVDPDLKLGRGGIREIEFFAQTQQLILGGRVKSLRQRRTDNALLALQEREALTEEARLELLACLRDLRMVEHRIQMLDDEQTHRVPKSFEGRVRLARFCGYETLEQFERELRDVRIKVAARYDSLFAQEESLGDEGGSLVFTGVDDDPDTLETLREMGFADPSRVAGIIRNWHRGHVRAMRSARAREILTRLMPVLLRGMANTSEPDIAFDRFNDFLAALPAGVQVLALLEAQPALLRGLLSALALSPLLAETLGRKPAILDSMFEPDFGAPIADETFDTRYARLQYAAQDIETFEDAINLVRRWRREEAFRIGFQTLTGAAHAEASGAAYADIADACVQLIADQALAEIARRHGPPPGRWAVFGLGKLGARELAEGSDLDIMVVYDPAENATDHPNAVDPVTYFTRATQRLIAGLSAPTEEGALYDVDMNLRPSGRAGPVAVRVSGFKTYYEKDAWSWELMALTRLRFAAGDESLGAEVKAIALAVLGRDRDEQKLAHDVADMRARIAREKGDEGLWDLKLAPGGILDLEFLAQYLTLKAGVAAGDLARANTAEAFRALERAGILGEDEAHALAKASHLLLSLTYVLRVAYSGKFDPDLAAHGLKRLLARAGEELDFKTLEQHLAELKLFVRGDLLKHLGPVATEAGLTPV